MNEGTEEQDQEQETSPSVDQEADDISGQNILIGKAIGANTDFLSSQSFISQSQQRVFFLIVSGAGEDAFSKLRKVGLDCKDKFSSEGEISQIIQEVLAFIKDELKILENLQVVIGAVKKDILYVTVFGGGEVYLSRRGKIIEITKNIIFEKIISGLLHPQDKVLFINSRYQDSDSNLAVWDPIFIQDLLETPVGELDEEIEVYMQRFSLNSPVAVASLEIPTTETEELSEEPIPKPVTKSPLMIVKPQPKSPFLPLLLFRLLFRSTKFKFILVGLILAMVGVGIFGVSAWQGQSRKSAQIKSHLTTSKQNLDQATSLKDSDPEGARTALSRARQEIQLALKVDMNDSQVKALESQINAQTGTILKEYQVDQFPTFMDLGLIKDGFVVTKLSYSLGKLALFDPKQKTLVMLDINDKNPKILAGQLQLGDGLFSSINGDKIFVYSKDKGVVSVDTGNSQADVAVKPDTEWQRISDIQGFANNIYLLDEFKNQIWKYIATETGFTERNPYLQPGVTADFAGIKKIQIDGAIWVLRSNNTVLKFISGASDHFAFQKLDKPMDNIKSLFVSDETEHAYFLDNDNGRVVQTKKNGEYIGQYSGEKFKTATDLVVDEEAKKLYLLEGGKIYLVDLQ